MSTESQELVRATPAPGSLAQDPNYGPGHAFAKGNTLGKMTTRGRQKIAAAIFNRALDVMMGAEPEPEDAKNALVHLINDMSDITLSRELRQKAAIAACKFVIGTRSNINLDLPEADSEDANERAQRLNAALLLISRGPR